MPTYDYQCDHCEHAFEHFQSISSDPLKKCPECGKNKLRRLFGTGAAIVFKGSGFYETDYRSESYKKGADAEKKKADSKSDKTAKSKADKSAETSQKSTSSEKKSTPKSSGD